MIKRVLALAFALTASTALGDNVVVTVDAAKSGAKINPRLYGIFLEEIGHGVDGGLYGEMIQNRGFEDAKAPEGFSYTQGRGRSGFGGTDTNGGRWTNPGGYATTFIWAADQSLPYWSLVAGGGAVGTMSLDMTNPQNTENPRACKLVVTNVPPGGRVGIANEGFCAAAGSSAIGIKQGEKYDLSFWARAEGFTGPLTAGVENLRGVAETDTPTVSGLTPQWKQFHTAFTASATDQAGRFVLSASAPGTIWFDNVSLFPAKTFKDRPNGLRQDIAQMIADLKPGFVRFPGGCVVESSTVATAYNWKNTLGPVEERPECWNAWDYRRTHGMGIFEYLQFIEDIGATPMYVGFAGQTCIYRAPAVVPLNQMQPIVDGYTDLLEYANGPVTSKWGKLRAASGHPEPFGMHLMEIGNENNGQAYAQRFPLILQAVKAAHPEVQTIADERVPNAEMIDEHHYADTNWFLNNTHLYDTANRNMPLYLGEVADTGQGQPMQRGNLLDALAEGSYLMGVERNGDVVKMVSYAPLLGNVRGLTQLAGAPPPWHAMIYFDSLHSFGTASYYLWRTFGINRPTVSLPATVAASGPATITGNIGVGTWGTSAEFKDIKVEKDGKTLFASDFSANAAGWRTEAGRWSVQDGAYRQSANVNAMAYIGDETWADYTITLKARKLAGGEGFLVAFGHKGADKYWWNVGGYGNTVQEVELNQGIIGRPVRAAVEANRWYDVKIEVAGTHIKTYLDGQLVNDVTARLPEPLQVAAGRDDDTGEIVLKVINPTASAVATTLNINGAPSIAPDAKMTLLTAANPNGNNTLANPTAIVPTESTATGMGPSFTREFPPYSLTVLRLKTRP